MNKIDESNDIDRSNENDPIQEKIWEIDKQAQQAKDNIKRIVELETVIRQALNILPLWGIPNSAQADPEHQNEYQAVIQMENNFRFILGEKITATTDPLNDIELPF
jgi:hypothetical protein